MVRRPGELAAKPTLPSPLALCGCRATAGERGARVDPDTGSGRWVVADLSSPGLRSDSERRARLLLTGAATACSVELQPETRLAAWKALQEAEERAYRGPTADLGLGG